MSEEFEVIGKRIPRIESIPKVTGSINYIADMILPGMLYARFLRSPHAHARVIGIDTSEAERLPGVKLILTPDDIVRRTYPIGRTLPKHQYCLHQEVRYVGDEVAAVAAVDEETAEEALGLIEVTYEVLPFVLDPEEAMSPGAPQLHEEERNIREPKKVRIGNIEDGFKEADCIVNERFQTSKQAHICLDTHGCLSNYNPATEKLTHWTSSQYIYNTRLSISGALDMLASKVRIINPEAIGGGFGGKAGTYSSDICAALMSKDLGQPVKMVLSREEEFMATRTQFPFIIEAEIGLKKDGTIVAWRGKVIIDTGAYSEVGPWVAICSQAMTSGPYKIPNIWIDTYPVYTNKSVCGALRGYGNPQITFARESLLDIAAEQLGMDPLELRLKNIIKPEDLPYTTSTGLSVRSCGIEECISKAAETIRWNKKREPYTGVGLAGMIHWSAVKVADVDFGSAEVEVAADGSLVIRTGNSDIGQGLYTVLAQVASEELGIPVENVTVVGADSEVTPPDLGCFASRSAVVTGSAVKRAAGMVKEKLYRIAGKMLEVSPEDLIARQGKIYIKDYSKAIAIEEVANAAYFTAIDGDASPIIGRGTWTSQTEVQDEDGYGNMCPTYAFSADAAEVEVDPETGRVEITKFVTAHDVGRVLNANIVEGQLHGGAGQGIGYGLLEEGISYDSKTGQSFNLSITDYKVPTAVDLPQIQPIIIETIDPDIPLGNKGVGETALNCVAPALANAIFGAVGVRITDLPITAAKILRALKEKDVTKCLE